MEITKELIKIFASWTKLKIRIHVSEKNLYFKAGQVWWASVGQNIGVESNGKNKKFERPVIIIKRFNKNSFLGIVLSSIKKIGKYYVELRDENNAASYVNLSQIKLMSSKRLLRFVREISASELDEIRSKIKDYL